MSGFTRLGQEIIACEACPRLRDYCRTVAIEKRKAYANDTYWGRPVPGFGDPAAWLWIVGLAPGAHGANRTGRVFTGDRSGDFLYAALHRTGMANQPTSVWREDGLQLTGVFISAAARCAPPDNKPLPTELAACSGYLDREWDLLANRKVILALGKIAWDASLVMAARNGLRIETPRPAFGHGAAVWLEKDQKEESHTTPRRKSRIEQAESATSIVALGKRQTASDHRSGIWLMGSYHVSQQNTFTGKLTPAMFDAVLQRAAEYRDRAT